MKKTILSITMIICSVVAAMAAANTAQFIAYVADANDATCKDMSIYLENAGYSPAFNNKGEDATKMARVAGKPYVYTLVEGKLCGSTGTNDLEGTFIVVCTTTATQYTFSFASVDGRDLYLKDHVTNVITPITTTDTYTFTATANSTLADRFEIVAEELLVYTRSLNANQVFGTICYPYKAEKILGGKIYKMNYFDGSSLFLELEDNPVGGMPYVFEADNAESVKWYYKDENRVDDIASVPGFVGTYTAITTPADNMYLVSNNKVQNYAAGSTVGEYRAYIVLEDVPTTDQYTSSAPERRLAFTVKKITTDNEQVAVKGMKDGVYMVNGQFVIVKDGNQFMVNGYNK